MKVGQLLEAMTLTCHFRKHTATRPFPHSSYKVPKLRPHSPTRACFSHTTELRKWLSPFFAWCKDSLRCGNPPSPPHIYEQPLVMLPSVLWCFGGLRNGKQKYLISKELKLKEGHHRGRNYKVHSDIGVLWFISICTAYFKGTSTCFEPFWILLHLLVLLSQLPVVV